MPLPPDPVAIPQAEITALVAAALQQAGFRDLISEVVQSALKDYESAVRTALKEEIVSLASALVNESLNGAVKAALSEAIVAEVKQAAAGRVAL